jgi:hypothetical protein
MISGQLALVTAALFTGAAIYVSVVEHSARMALDDRAMLTEWKPSYKRGFAMQGTLAMIGALLGALAFWQTRDWTWLAGALLLFAGWPYTLIALMPINSRLLAIAPENAGPTTRKLIEGWGRLHLVRVMFGALATAAFLAATLA